MGEYGFRHSESPLINNVWWATVDEDARYTDAANEFWGLAFGSLADGTPTATLAGPSLAPRELRLVAGERHWGVEFAAHVFLRGLPKPELVDQLRELPTDGRWFTVVGSRFPVPGADPEDPGAIERLIEVLQVQGVLTADHRVAAALGGTPEAYSARSTRRQVGTATGLSPKQVQQLQRARAAYRALQQGSGLAEAAQLAGFADQAHMTRALGVLAGMTPARIVAADAGPFDSRD